MTSLTTLNVEFVSESAGYKNTFGWYNKRTGEGGILFSSIEAEGRKPNVTSGTSVQFTVATNDLADIAYFLIPDGGARRQNTTDELTGPIKVVRLADGSWAVATVDANGHVETDSHGKPNILSGEGANALFSEKAKNAGSVDYVSSKVGSAQTAATLGGDSADGPTGLLAWEDLAATRKGNGTYSKPGDADYNDAVFNITIANAGNRPPIIAPIASATNEDSAPVLLDLVQGASDPDGNAVNVGTVSTVVSSNGARVIAYTLSGNHLTINPAQFNDLRAGVSETVTITYTVTDGTATVTNTAALVVEGRNDAAVIGVPSMADVTEDAASPTLTAVGSISISDIDQGQSTFQTTVAAAVGNLGVLSLAANGQYTYSVANAAVQFLDAGDSKVDTFTVTSLDGTSRAVSFTIHGTNDAAVIGAPTVADVTEDATSPTLTAAGSISISDADQNQSSFQTTVIAAAGNLGALSLAGNGQYTYGVANAAVQHLGAGETKIDTFTVTALDGTTRVVSFTIHGTNDAAVIGAPSVADVTEDTASPTLTAVGSISISDADQNQSSFQTAVIAAAGNLGTLSLAADGTYTYSVANAAVQHLGATGTHVDTFTVTSLDGTGRAVSFTIHGTNDAPVIALVSGGTTNEDAAPVTIDLVQGALDIDGDTVHVDAVNSAMSSNASRVVGYALAGDTLSIDPAQFNDLAVGQSETITFSYAVTDGTATVPNTATLVVEGRNDAPVATAYVEPLPLYEGGWLPYPYDFNYAPSNIAFSLSSNVSDPDMGDVVSLAGLAPGIVTGPINTIHENGLYGRLVNIHSDLSMGYEVVETPALDALRIGESVTETFTYSVTDGHGGYATSTISLEIRGRNDAPTALAVVPNFELPGLPVVPELGTDNYIASIFKSGFAFDFASLLGIDGQDPDALLTPDQPFRDFLRIGATFTGDISELVGARITTATRFGDAQAIEFIIDGIEIAGDYVRVWSHPYKSDGITFEENLAPGTLIARLQGYDPDHDSVFTYLFGPETPASLPFEIVNGNEVRVKAGAALDYESAPSGWQITIIAGDEYYDGNILVPAALTSFKKVYSILLADVNEAPTANPDDNAADPVVESGVAPGDATATGNVLDFNDTDPDVLSSEIMVVQGIAAGPATGPLSTSLAAPIDGIYGSLSISGDGNYTYTLDDSRSATNALAYGEVVTDVFTYTMHDKGGLTSTSTLTITITGANDAHVATDSVARTNEDTVIEGLLTARDVDHGDVLTFTTDLDPSHGTVMVDLNGHLTFTPAEGFAGSDSFTFTVQDGHGGSDTGRVDITVDGAGRQNITYLYSGAEVQNEKWGNIQSSPEAIALPNGGHLVLFSVANGAINGSPAGSNTEVWGQLWDAAGERTGASFRLNVPSANGQDFPSVGVFADGSFVAVWESTFQVGFNTAIVGRKFNPDGTPATGEFVVNTTTSFSREQPAVVALDDGGFAVSWSGFNTGNNTTDVFARFYVSSLDGGTGLPVPRTGEFVVHSAVASQQQSDARLAENMVTLDDGRVVIVWSDSSGGSADVSARIFNSNGTPSSVGGSANEFRVNTTLTGSQDVASVGKLADGGFVVVWEQTRSDGLFIPKGTDIYAQRYHADGTRNGGEVKVNTFDAYEQLNPKVAGTPDGGFTIIWQSQAVDGSANYKIAGQRFDADGQATGSEFIVDADNRLEAQTRPDLVVRENGALVVVWQDTASFSRGGGNRWIGQQIIDEPTDVRLIESTEPDELVSNVSAANNLRRPDVVALADGGHLVVWLNSNGDSEGGVITARGVWGQRYDAIGDKVGAPIQISVTYPSISPGRDHTATTALDDGGFVVVWSSFAQTGQGNWDIWGRKFDASGTATGGEFLVTHVSGSPGVVAAGNQQMPSVVGLTGGGFVVSWDHPDASGFNDNVVFKIYTNALSAGAPVEATGQIVASTAVAQAITQEGDVAQPIARLADGRFVLTWTAPDPSGTGVWARIFNADGTPAAGNEFRINMTTNGNERMASVGALDDGGFVVTWTGRLATGQETVMMQRYDAAGATIGVETVVPSHDFNHTTHYAKVEGLPDGGWAVIWQSFGTSGLNNAVDGNYNALQNDGIAGQRYDALGNKVGSQFLISADGYGAEQKPSLDVRADGALLVAWVDASGRRVEQVVVDDPGDAAYTSDLGLPQPLPIEGIFPHRGQAHTIALQDGGHLTVWFEDANSGNDRYQVHARKYDAAGEAVGSEFVYNAGFRNFNAGSSAPGVAQLADGNLVLTWIYFNTGPLSVQGRMFDAALNPLGSGDFQITANFIQPTSNSYVAALENGDFVVNWKFAGVNNSDIAGRVFDGTINPGTGQPDALTAAFMVNTTLPGAQEQRGTFFGETPLIGLEGGRFVSVWSDDNGNTAPFADIKARLFEADGTPVTVNGSTAEFTLNTTTVGNQFYPSAAALEGGGFVVVWTSPGISTTALIPIIAQRFDADGHKLGGEVVVNGFDYGSSPSDPRVQGLDDGGFVVVWTGFGELGSTYSVLGQRFDAVGDKVDGLFVINEPFQGINHTAPTFDVRNDGTLAVTWDLNTNRLETRIVDFGEVQPKEFVGTNGNDSFIGSRYADDIAGGAGDDLLTGGAGRDVFQFNFATDGVDTVTDFAHNIDTLEISAGGFGGGLLAGQVPNFVLGGDIAGFTFASGEGHFFFDDSGAGAGTLYWDTTGDSASDAVAIAVLQNVTILAATDFHIIA